MRLLSARQLREWMDYYQLEPFGEWREELRHGQRQALLANINRDPEKRKEPFDEHDFMNFVPHEQERQLTPEEIEQYYSRIFRGA